MNYSKLKRASFLALATLFAPSMSEAASATVAVGTAVKSATVRTPQSIECSKEADAKGLHGPDRQKFRRVCKAKLKQQLTTQSPALQPGFPEKHL